MTTENTPPESRPESRPESPSTGHPTLKAVSNNSRALALFALLTVGLVSLTWLMTKERIAEQIRLSEQRALFEVLPPSTFDNNLLDSTITLPEPAMLGPIGQQAQGWLAFKEGQPTAIIVPTVAPDGYNGRIQLLVGIRRDGVLTGVRTIAHKETPGLGDGIETRVSDWILDFTGRSLTKASGDNWAVKKEGGDFDQFTGATITPRAVVNAVHRTLVWFDQHHTQLFTETFTEAFTEKEGDG